MPVMTLWRCPVCGAQTDPFTGLPPEGWITIAAHASVPEVFDKWECVGTWTQQQQAAAVPA